MCVFSKIRLRVLLIIFTGLFIRENLFIVSSIAESTEISDLQSIDLFSSLASSDMRTLAGTPVNVDEFRHHPLIIHLWAPWCAVCIPELSELNLLQKKIAGSNIQIITIASLTNAEEVKNVLGYSTFSFVSLIDSKGIIYKHFNNVGVPITFFVDSSSKLVLKRDQKDNLKKLYFVGSRNWLSSDMLRSILTLQ